MTLILDPWLLATFSLSWEVIPQECSTGSTPLSLNMHDLDSVSSGSLESGFGIRDANSALTIPAAVSRHQWLCANEAQLGAF